MTRCNLALGDYDYKYLHLASIDWMCYIRSNVFIYMSSRSLEGDQIFYIAWLPLAREHRGIN
jgi:hypothetical protein